MTAIVRLQERLQATSSTGLMRLDLTLPQVKVLMVVGASGETRMSEIGRGLGASASTATGIVDRLAERRLVERVRDAQDRRVVRVRLTAVGEETLAQIAALTNTRMRELLARLTSAELATVRRAMELLTEAGER